MKNTFYLLLSGLLLLFAGCHEVTVGYLYTDEAKYPLNRMDIYNIPNRITELKGRLDAFKEQTVDLQNEYDRVNSIYLARQADLDEYNQEVVFPAQDSVDKILIKDTDMAKRAELEKRLEEVIRPHQEELVQIRDKAQAEVKAAEKAINDLADRLGIESPLIVQQEIDDLQSRLDYEIPWTTSLIQGVLGTEPLLYEIESVKGPDADAFLRYTGMMGGGRIYVKWDIDVPAGEYVVSVKVSNEGYIKVFEDAFTFVVSN